MSKRVYSQLKQNSIHFFLAFVIRKERTETIFCVATLCGATHVLWITFVFRLVTIMLTWMIAMKTATRDESIVQALLVCRFHVLQPVKTHCGCFPVWPYESQRCRYILTDLIITHLERRINTHSPCCSVYLALFRAFDVARCHTRSLIYISCVFALM